MDCPVKYNFTEDWFKDEVREGHLVTECMKRYWAASLHSLEIFDDICKRHGLRYWAACGTMLGTIRHKGFIPWDDDLDIGMLREDFNGFLEIVPKELPPEYVVTCREEPPMHDYNGIAVVNSLRAVSFDEKVLQEYYYCPFPVGFDVYPYDFVPDDKNARDIWRGKYLKVLLAFTLLREREKGDKEASEALKELGIDPKTAWDDIESTRNRLFEKAERIAGENRPDCGKYANRLIFLATHNDYRPLRREWYTEIEEMPFETGTMPAITHIEDAVNIVFGKNWQTPVKNTMAHEYPLYKQQLIHMIGFLQKGGLRLSDLPPRLQYLKREADHLGLDYIT